jgi:hypothetical protein
MVIDDYPPGVGNGGADVIQNLIDFDIYTRDNIEVKYRCVSVFRVVPDFI